MLLYLPGSVGLLALMLWLGVPIAPALIAVAGVAVALTLVSLRINRKRR
jgi:hypothetical protein